MTDDYVPVENLLAPVAREDAKYKLAQRYIKDAEDFSRQAKWKQSIAMYEKAVQTFPERSIEIYNQIGIIWSIQSNWQEAADAFQNALNYSAKNGDKENITGSIYLNLGSILNALGRTREARENFAKAVEQLRIEVTENPNSHSLYTRLGSALTMMGDFKAASEAFRQALVLNPSGLPCYYDLVNSLLYQNRLDEAINVLQDGVKFMSSNGQTEAVAELKKRLDLLESQKSQQQKQ